MRVTVLGCGTSGGVPRIGNQWGACEPANPRNRRRRASILVEKGDTVLIVDTSPDLREQLLEAEVSRLDGVLYTHDHADHVHGIDDLRVLAYARRAPLEVYAERATLQGLGRRFDYAFGLADNSLYPAIVSGREIDGPFTVGEIEVVPFEQDHGDRTSLGFRFGAIAYSTDVVRLSEAAFAALAGVEVWLVDALRYRPHPTHAHVDQALAWIERVAPERAVLTHMTAELDYATLGAELPSGVEPAYDGLRIETQD